MTMMAMMMKKEEQMERELTKREPKSDWNRQVDSELLNNGLLYFGHFVSLYTSCSSCSAQAGGFLFPISSQSYSVFFFILLLTLL